MSKMMNPYPKINICLVTCSHKGPNNLNTHSSYINLLSHVPPNFGVTYITATEAGISKSRSYWATVFLRNLPKCQILAFIDDDMIWKSEDFFKICKEAYDRKCIYGGVYVKREFPTTAIVSLLNGEDKFEFNNEVIEVAGLGCGFIAIHRDVVAGVASHLELVDSGKTNDDGSPFLVSPVFGELFISKPGAKYKSWISEDYSFCYLAREEGFEVIADSSIFLKHYGGYDFSANDLLIKFPDK